jgi:hypothetical protein
MDPLREEGVAGIFPLGADFLVSGALDGHTVTDGSCCQDVVPEGV